METQPISASDIQAFVTFRRLIPIWIIHFGFAMGPIIFAVTIYIIHSLQSNIPPIPESEMSESIHILSWVNVCITSVSYIMFALTNRIPEKLLQGSTQHNNRLFAGETNNNSEDINPAGLLMPKFYGRMIIRLALLETPAMFGLIVCFIGIQSGVIYQQNDYLFNGLPAAGFLAYAFLKIPTRDRVVAQLEQMLELSSRS